MDKGIIYFTAPWCEPCRLLGPVMEQLTKQYNIPVKKINTDYDAIATEQYNVKSVPTLIISDRQGRERKPQRASGRRSASHCEGRRGGQERQCQCISWQFQRISGHRSASHCEGGWGGNC